MTQRPFSILTLSMCSRTVHGIGRCVQQAWLVKTHDLQCSWAVLNDLKQKFRDFRPFCGVEHSAQCLFFEIWRFYVHGNNNQNSLEHISHVLHVHRLLHAFVEDLYLLIYTWPLVCVHKQKVHGLQQVWLIGMVNKNSLLVTLVGCAKRFEAY